MDKYLEKNQEYWAKGYEADNVESFVFRPYGRIFKGEFGLSGEKGEKLLDFGCGQGGALRFFKSKGFDVYGVDISETDIGRCRASMPDIKDHFGVIPAKPEASDVFFGGGYDLVVAVQALYYYNDEDMRVRMESLHRQMKPGAILYATMMGTGHYMYKHSHEHQGGLRRVEFDTPRLKVKDYFVNFTLSKEHLLKKFAMFEKVHVGFYDAQYREEDGGSYHYTYIGRKAR